MRGAFTEIRGSSRLMESHDLLAFIAFTLLLMYGYIIILNISEDAEVLLFFRQFDSLMDCVSFSGILGCSLFPSEHQVPLFLYLLTSRYLL